MFGFLFLLLVGAAIWVVAGTLAILHRLTHPPRLTYGVAVARNWHTSPTDLGLSFTSELATFSDGNTTPVWIIQGQGPQNQAPTIILTHGWSHSRLALLPLIEQLAPFASKLIAYDLRGQGESSAPKSTLSTHEVDDLLTLAKQYTQTQPETSPSERPEPLPKSEEKKIPGGVVFVGQSMGGGISLVAAAKAAQLGFNLPIRGVIIDGAYRLGMEPVSGYFHEHGLPLWPFYLPVAWHLTFWYDSNKHFDRAKHAKNLPCPLLVLHGELDPTCQPDSARAIAESASSTGHGSTLVTFPTGSHLDLMEIDPEKYHQALVTFFDQLTAVALTSQPTPPPSSQPAQEPVS